MTRRDFMRLVTASSGAAVAPPLLERLPGKAPGQAGAQNVIVVVFDAFAASNMSLYGYPRRTTPSLERLAEQAIVYHRHHATANFTTPGTASLLTGVHSWTHRGLQRATPVIDAVRSQTFFHAFPQHTRIVYTHNPLAARLFTQFRHEIDIEIPVEDLLLTSDGFIQQMFHGDDDAASVGWIRAMKKEANGGSAYSLLLSRAYGAGQARRISSFKQGFPRGLPYIREDNYFVLEQAIDALARRAQDIPQPFLGYFHFIPPHDPYRTPTEFFGRFTNDGLKVPRKPMDLFGVRRWDAPLLYQSRTEYDEYILYVDREFARFHEMLEAAGLLENTWLVMTSDHGEMFERHVWRHTTPVLYDPVIRVPLMIFEPGRRKRLDIHTSTSAVDLLPTLASAAGGDTPDWTEGTIMPPFADMAEERSIWAVEAKHNRPLRALTTATVMLLKGSQKLTYYFGYAELGGAERIELYDLAEDPQELNSLYAPGSGVAAALLDEVHAKLREVNERRP